MTDATRKRIGAICLEAVRNGKYATGDSDAERMAMQAAADVIALFATPMSVAGQKSRRKNLRR